MHGRCHGHGVCSHVTVCPGSGRQRRAPMRPMVEAIMMVVVHVAGWARCSCICMGLSVQWALCKAINDRASQEQEGQEEGLQASAIPYRQTVSPLKATLRFQDSPIWRSLRPRNGNASDNRSCLVAADSAGAAQCISARSDTCQRTDPTGANKQSPSVSNRHSRQCVWLSCTSASYSMLEHTLICQASRVQKWAVMNLHKLARMPCGRLPHLINNLSACMCHG